MEDFDKLEESIPLPFRRVSLVLSPVKVIKVKVTTMMTMMILVMVIMMMMNGDNDDNAANYQVKGVCRSLNWIYKTLQFTMI